MTRLQSQSAPRCSKAKDKKRQGNARLTRCYRDSKQERQSRVGAMNKVLILTINIWAIAMLHLSLDRAARLSHFISHIQSQPLAQAYDIICIQELWDESDFLMLKRELASMYPTACYAAERRSLTGSGLAIFSRYRLIHQEIKYFPMNGKPERIDHGDWLCSKGIFRVTLEDQLTGQIMDVYTAHLIAEYDSSYDIYLTHRLAQIVHLKELVGTLSHPDRLVFIAGDLNSRPFETAYQYLMTPEVIASARADESPRLIDSQASTKGTGGSEKHSNLVCLNDAWLESRALRSPTASTSAAAAAANNLTEANELGATFAHPSNFYSARKAIPERIDYILYLTRLNLALIDCWLAFAERLQCGISISDHCGVAAEFHFGALPSRQPDTAVSAISSLAKFDSSTLDRHSVKANVPSPLPPRYVHSPATHIDRASLAPVFEHRKSVLKRELLYSQTILNGLVFGLCVFLIFISVIKKQGFALPRSLLTIAMLVFAITPLYIMKAGLESEIQLHSQYAEKLYGPKPASE